MAGRVGPTLWRLWSCPTSYLTCTITPVAAPKTSFIWKEIKIVFSSFVCSGENLRSTLQSLKIKTSTVNTQIQIVNREMQICSHANYKEHSSISVHIVFLGRNVVQSAHTLQNKCLQWHTLLSRKDLANSHDDA